MPRLARTRRASAGSTAFLLVCSLAVVTATPERAVAASILLDPPSGWNGMFIQGTVVAGWRESGGVLTASSTSTGFLLAGPTDPPLVPGQVLTGTPLSLLATPGSGAVKDKAEVSLAYSVQVGTSDPDSSDKFFFDIDATTSAESARYDFGGGLVNADAYVTVDIQMMSAAPVPAGALASIRLPALPTLTATAPSVESLTAGAEIGPYGAPTSTWSMGPGDSGPSIPLVLDPSTSDTFVYKLRYELLTPFGSDPTVSISLVGDAARAVPEPAGMLVAGSAAACGLGLRLHPRGRGRIGSGR